MMNVSRTQQGQSNSRTQPPSQTRTPPIIVMTDLDGTLLDHMSYSFDAASHALTRLQKASIPVIINTSKTRAEVEAVREALDNQDPFVCENGSAIYVAKENSGSDFPTDSRDDYNQEILGADYAFILRQLHQARQQGFNFRGFNDMPTNEVAALTGLETTLADMAKMRQASEPLVWNGDEASLNQFRELLAASNLRLVRGGRFYHVMGKTDKSDGVTFFREYFRPQTEPESPAPIVIALGDGENDIAMLDHADYAVVIPGHNRTISCSHPNPITAKEKGPVGWNQVINQLLDQLL